MLIIESVFRTLCLGKFPPKINRVAAELQTPDNRQHLSSLQGGNDRAQRER